MNEAQSQAVSLTEATQLIKEAEKAPQKTHLHTHMEPEQQEGR